MQAYSIFDVQQIDTAQRIIEGTATTPEVNRKGDAVVCTGAIYTLPLPLCWQHEKAHPIGEVIHAEVSPTGIFVRATIARITEPGPMRDLCDKAFKAVQHKLVKGLSIGYRPLKHTLLSSGGFQYDSWDWLELSLVHCPANVNCTIDVIEDLAEGTYEPEASDDFWAWLEKRGEMYAHAGGVMPTVEFMRGLYEDEQRQLAPKQKEVNEVRRLRSKVRQVDELLAMSIRAGLQYRQRIEKLEEPQPQSDIIETLKQRVEKLEAQPVFKYYGVFADGTVYRPGQCITYKGAVWHCNDITDTRPPGPAWTLAVKSGRDGRDLTKMSEKAA